MDCTFDSSRNLIIGDNSVINSKCRLDTRGSIQMGNNVSISSEVIILTADHNMDNNMAGRERKVTIEDYVWVGTRAVIMPGVTLHKGAVIATGAIVTKDVPEFAVVAGVPAKVIKTRPHQAEFDFTVSYRRLFQ